MSQNVMKRVVAIAISAVLVLALAAPIIASWADDGFATNRTTEYDDELEAAKREKERLSKEAESLKGDLEDTDEQLTELVIRLKEIEGELVLARAEQIVADKEVERTERELNDLRSRLEDAQERQQSLEDEIAANHVKSDEARAAVALLARQSYRQGAGASTSGLARLLSNDITEDTLASMTVTDRAMRAQRAVIDDLAQLDAENRNAELRLEAVRDEIDLLVEEAADKFEEAQEAKEQADAWADSVNNLLTEQKNKADRLESLKRDLEGQLLENDQRRAESENEIKALGKKQADAIAEQIAEEERKKREEENSGGGGSSPAPTTTPPSSGGVLRYPTAVPYITSHYGMRVHPVFGYPRMHAGTDFRAYCGTQILASRDGQVQWARYLGGFGNQVLIDHGAVNGVSLMTSYNHLSRFAVSSGQEVKAGQVIGYSGTTGTSTACHLHFEVYVNGNAVNPLGWL